VEAFLARCQPLEVIALVAVLAAALVGVVALLVWRQVRLNQAVLALKQESVQKGLSVAEIHDLVSGPSLFGSHSGPKGVDTLSDADIVGFIASILKQCQLSAPEVEQYLALVQAADSPTKQAINAAFRSSTYDRDKKHAVAVIRALCGAGSPERTGGSVRPNTCVPAVESTTEPRPLAEQVTAAPRPRE
jgi:hypothetical protein